MLAVRDAASVPLKDRNQVNKLVAAENADRQSLYQAIANANGHPEWAAQIKSTFAARWVSNAQARLVVSILWKLEAEISMARKRSRKKQLPETPVKVTIESLAHDGRGVAHVDGKVIFIDEALPGEEVEFIYTESRKDYAEGKVVTLLSRAADRVDALCPHYGVCGGCSFQHVESSAQIRIKQDLLAEQFKRIGKVEMPELWQPLEGPHWGYRRKARMGVKYVAKKNRVLVGFRERRHPYLAEIDSCIVMHPIVGTKLIALGEMIAGLTIRDKIPQIEVAIGDEQVRAVYSCAGTADRCRSGTDACFRS